MRMIVTLFIVGSAIFAGYWAIAAQLITRFAPDTLAQTAHLAATPREVTGFPFAFRTELEDLTLKNQDQTFNWHVPLVALEAASHLPTRVDARFSRTQAIDYLGLRIALHHDGMHADLAVDHRLRVTSASGSIRSATATPPVFLQSLDGLQAVLKQAEGEQYTLNWTAQGLRLSPEARLALDPSGTHPEQIENLEFKADIAFAGPLALNAPMPQPLSISLRDIAVDWGEFTLSGDGQLQKAAAGGFDGTLSLRLQDWRVLHALLVDTGTIAPDAAMMAGMFLASQAEPGGTSIDLPLNVANSAVAFGPFVIGRLPRF